MLPQRPYDLFNQAGQMRLSELSRMRRDLERAPLVSLSGAYSQSPSGLLLGKSGGGSGSGTPFVAIVSGQSPDIKLVGGDLSGLGIAGTPHLHLARIIGFNPGSMNYGGQSAPTPPTDPNTDALLWNVVPAVLTPRMPYLCWYSGQCTFENFTTDPQGDPASRRTLDVYLTMAGWVLSDSASASCLGDQIVITFTTY